jgi:hypothetical protein
MSSINTIPLQHEFPLLVEPVRFVFWHYLSPLHSSLSISHSSKLNWRCNAEHSIPNSYSLKCQLGNTRNACTKSAGFASAPQTEEYPTDRNWVVIFPSRVPRLGELVFSCHFNDLDGPPNLPDCCSWSGLTDTKDNRVVIQAVE